jgi:alpha-tubulin suppressor-like RCC1 family protein
MAEQRAEMESRQVEMAQQQQQAAAAQTEMAAQLAEQEAKLARQQQQVVAAAKKLKEQEQEQQHVAVAQAAAAAKRLEEQERREQERRQQRAAEPAAEPAGAELVLVCGKNGSGELGVPGGSKIKVPTAVMLPGRVVDAQTDVACIGGSGAGVFVTAVGELFFCGKNPKADLFGCGANGAKVPAPMRSADAPPGASSAEIFSDGEAALCLTDGALWGRGDGRSGQLGGGGDERSWGRLKVGSAPVVAVATTWYTAAAVTASGEVYTWGLGSDGRLGQGEKIGSGEADNCHAPKPVAGNGQKAATTVSLGGGFGMLLTVDSQVYSWGYGRYGRTGLGHTKSTSTPQHVAALAGVGVVAISCGWRHALAIGGGGELYSWGDNSNGRTGLGTTKTHTAQPTRVSALAGEAVEQIGAGFSHSVARVAGDRIFVWGCGDDGRLGLGDTKDRSTPTLNPALSSRGLRLPYALGCSAKATIVGTSMRSGL